MTAAQDSAIAFLMKIGSLLALAFLALGTMTSCTITNVNYRVPGSDDGYLGHELQTSIEQSTRFHDKVGQETRSTMR